MWHDVPIFNYKEKTLELYSTTTTSTPSFWGDIKCRTSISNPNLYRTNLSWIKNPTSSFRKSMGGTPYIGHAF